MIAHSMIHFIFQNIYIKKSTIRNIKGLNINQHKTEGELNILENGKMDSLMEKVF
jgi:hypothetical protein